MKQVNVAVDIGGTFTDLLAFDTETGRIHQAKCLSTPPDFATGVLDGVRKATLDLRQVESFIHGSTVAINTAIERTGARTALIVTRGTRDVYQIGRGNRPEAYNILFQRAGAVRAAASHVRDQPSAPPPAARRCVPFDEAQAREVAKQVLAEDIDAGRRLLPALLANPDHESRIGDILRDVGSKQVLRHLARDLARVPASTSACRRPSLNAYVGPRVSKYVSRSREAAGARRFRRAAC